MGGIEVRKCVVEGSGGRQTLSGMFGNEGFLGLGSMVLMGENVCLHVVDVWGRIRGCVEIIDFSVLGWKENGEVRMDVMAGGAAAVHSKSPIRSPLMGPKGP